MGILIEHFGGAFPLWLSPVQVQVIPIGLEHEKYAEEVKELLSAEDIRVEVKNENESIGKKIRNGEMQKIPYILVVGDKEMKSRSVAVRQRSKGDLGPVELKKFLENVKLEKDTKKL
jgi:threonyl-tRNA synthetase